MKLLAADHTEHTVTLGLDNGMEFVASNVHEDIIIEVQRELYGESFLPGASQPDRGTKAKKPLPTPADETDFI